MTTLHSRLSLIPEWETHELESDALYEQIPFGMAMREPGPDVEILAEVPPRRHWLSSLAARRRRL